MKLSRRLQKKANNVLDAYRRFVNTWNSRAQGINDDILDLMKAEIARRVSKAFAEFKRKKINQVY